MVYVVITRLGITIKLGELVLIDAVNGSRSRNLIREVWVTIGSYMKMSTRKGNENID